MRVGLDNHTQGSVWLGLMPYPDEPVFAENDWESGLISVRIRLRAHKSHLATLIESAIISSITVGHADASRISWALGTHGTERADHIRRGCRRAISPASVAIATGVI